MKALFIGGTGNISSSVSQLAIEKGIDLYHLNRGNRPSIAGVKEFIADSRNLEQIRKALANHNWDVVVNWIVFAPEDVSRDFELFNGKVGQYIFISSASVYQKPLLNPVITGFTLSFIIG